MSISTQETPDLEMIAEALGNAAMDALRLAGYAHAGFFVLLVTPDDFCMAKKMNNRALPDLLRVVADKIEAKRDAGEPGYGPSPSAEMN